MKTCDACESEFKGRGKYCDDCKGDFEFTAAIDAEVDTEPVEDFADADDFDGGAFGEGGLK